jgi:predicted Zn finger-like uncharacterized protein
MKITCERCSAQYDLDENRIPPSGMTMKCPACLHAFVVRKNGAVGTVPSMPAPPAQPAPSPPAKREIELSSFGDDDGPTPLPPTAPGMMAPATPTIDDEIDLPAPVDVPRQRDVIDLPAPKASSKGAAIPPMRPPAIPPPRPPAMPPPQPSKTPTIDREPTRDDSSISIARDSIGPDEIDLPAPVDLSQPRDVIDLPAPKVAQSHNLHDVDDGPDLVAPKERAPQVGISLDAPDPDDLVDGVGMPGIDLDSIDVVAPKSESAELPTPKIETYDIAPKAQTMDVAPKPAVTDVAPKAAREAPAEFKPVGEPAPPPPVAEAAAEAPPPRRRGRLLLAIALVTVVLGGVGVALGVFTGFGAQLFHRGPSAQVEQQMNAARMLMGEDTLTGYRKASGSLEALVAQDAKLDEAAALAAQAHLRIARLGVKAELTRADALLAKITDEKSQQLPDVAKARALRSLVTGNYADARTKLNAILQRAPADAIALVTLGWTELAAGDDAAADKAFGKALAAEATRAAALYGGGVAKEHLGDPKTAADLYGRALARSPQHFGGAVGVARTTKAPAEAQAEIEALIKDCGAVAGPREVADAWATIGMLAAAAGRRDDAEDRLKRALALDPDLATARVTLADVACDLKHCGDAIAPLQKLVAAQPKNLPARLALTRAQLETNALADAQATLAPALKDAPKDGGVLYWQARLMLAGPKPDREQAVAKLKDAIAANPKLIQAYVVESNALAQLGRADDALAPLQSAQERASDDPELMVQLGEAYLGLGKPADAAERFNAALAKKPDLQPARMDLALALENQGKLDEAQAELEKVDAKYPGLTARKAELAARQGHKDDAYKLYAQALAEGTPTAALRLAAGQLDLDPAIAKPDEARKLAESIISDDDRSPAGHLLLATMLFQTGRFEDALPEARRAATLEDRPESHLLLGQVLEALAKLDQAINEYNQARRPPVEGLASLGRARILVRMGATKDALSELTALAKDPKLRAPALILMGDCYADLQQADRARHSYEDAVKAAPDSADAAFKLGRAFHDAGRRRDAITQVERALKLGGDKQPWSAEAWLLLGDAHREGKENDAAVKAYKKYLELAPPEAPARKEVERNVSLLGGG